MDGIRAVAVDFVVAEDVIAKVVEGGNDGGVVAGGAGDGCRVASAGVRCACCENGRIGDGGLKGEVDGCCEFGVVGQAMGPEDLLR